MKRPSHAELGHMSARDFLLLRLNLTAAGVEIAGPGPAWAAFRHALAVCGRCR